MGQSVSINAYRISNAHYRASRCRLKKAFDSSKHDILLKMLPLYDVRTPVLNLIKDCIFRRYTKLNGTKSKLRNIAYRVLQGSILGPPLFILNVDDIVQIPETPDI